MKLILDEWIVREVIDTLYMARTMLLGITGLDSPQEVAKKSANETAITRRISKAIDIIQQSGQPHICESLEEAAEKYSDKYCSDWAYRLEYEDAFKAGAEWQARQLLQGSPMPEDTVLFNKGVAEGRRLEREDMLKDAVEEPFLPCSEEDKDMIVGRDYVPVDWVETLDLYGRWKIIPMKDAVEGDVHHCMSAHYVVTNENQLAEALKRFNDGDKVRIIILPKEDGE